MKFKIIYFILFCLVSVIFCAGINNRYVMRNSHQGTLVHIFEQKMPKEQPNKVSSDIKYDYTYLEESDSVTFLSYISLAQVQTPISISFLNDQIDYTQKVELIFVQPKGKKFQYRLKITIPFQTWKNFYESTSPFKVKYLFDNNGHIENYVFGYKGKKWISNRDNMIEIIRIIELNKK